MCPTTSASGIRTLDQALLGDCRGLVLAMVAAWRWDRTDQFPNGQRAARDLLTALREGPPYPPLDAVMARPADGRPPGDDQLISKTTVTFACTSCVPGWTGVAASSRAPAAAYIGPG